MWHVSLEKERLGQISKNKYGSSMEIVKYNHARDIWVKFLDTGNMTHTYYIAFCRGEVKNVYDKSVYGVGYLGEGIYTPFTNGKSTSRYKIWRGMFQRCFDNKLHLKYPSYKECSISEEWYNFQNFAKWYDENYYEIEGQRMDLDKDILIKGNKHYSPETCIIVPQCINTLFTKTNSKRGKYPIGVSLENGKVYVAHCMDGNKNKCRIGTFNTPEQAFFAYKSFKEKLIKQIAERYKNEIPYKLYEAMINYIVEITD